MCGIAALGSATPLSAELNVPIAARVVSFLQPSPVGTIATAIVFEPGNAVSEAEASAIERSIGASLPAGRSAIRARRVPISAIGSLSGFRVAFVTSGLRSEHAGIAAAASKSSVLTISSDPICVQSARCVVGITPGPRTQITVNRAAARAANIKFGSAFLMLIKEI
jgi:hypothetical protein